MKRIIFYLSLLVLGCKGESQLDISHEPEIIRDTFSYGKCLNESLFQMEDRLAELILYTEVDNFEIVDNLYIVICAGDCYYYEFNITETDTLVYLSYTTR